MFGDVGSQHEPAHTFPFAGEAWVLAHPHEAMVPVTQPSVVRHWNT